MLTLGLVVGLVVGGTVGAICMAAVASARDADPSLWPETELDRLSADELREALRTKSPVVAMADVIPFAAGPIDDAPIARRPQRESPMPAA